MCGESILQMPRLRVSHAFKTRSVKLFQTVSKRARYSSKGRFLAGLGFLRGAGRQNNRRVQEQEVGNSLKTQSSRS